MAKLVSPFLIENLQDYITAIEVLSKLCYTRQPDFLYYRGQDDERYDLLPSIYRITEDGNMKIVVPEPFIIDLFIKESSAFLPNKIIDKDHKKWLTYAQHFGLPTRLLDWTSNSLAALYFAVCDQNDYDGAVWILNGALYEKYIDERVNISEIHGDLIEKYCKGAFTGDDSEIYQYPQMFMPQYIDERMRSQTSRFMVWGSEKVPLNKFSDVEIIPYRCSAHNSYRSKITYKLHYKPEQFLIKILISGKHKGNIMRQLDYCGINRITLFPGVDSVGNYIKQKFDREFASNKDYFSQFVFKT